MVHETVYGSYADGAGSSAWVDVVFDAVPLEVFAAFSEAQRQRMYERIAESTRREVLTVRLEFGTPEFEAWQKAPR